MKFWLQIGLRFAPTWYFMTQPQNLNILADFIYFCEKHAQNWKMIAWPNLFQNWSQKGSIKCKNCRLRLTSPPLTPWPHLSWLPLQTQQQPGDAFPGMLFVVDGHVELGPVSSSPYPLQRMYQRQIRPTCSLIWWRIVLYLMFQGRPWPSHHFPYTSGRFLRCFGRWWNSSPCPGLTLSLLTRTISWLSTQLVEEVVELDDHRGMIRTKRHFIGISTIILILRKLH